jgi:hypothetical protein
MGAMHTWLWGERYPTAVPLLCAGIAYALLPAASSSFPLAMVLLVLGAGGIVQVKIQDPAPVEAPVILQ